MVTTLLIDRSSSPTRAEEDVERLPARHLLAADGGRQLGGRHPVQLARVGHGPPTRSSRRARSWGAPAVAPTLSAVGRARLLPPRGGCAAGARRRGSVDRHGCRPDGPGPGRARLDGSPAGARPANAGVVVDADGITVIDTLMVPSQWEPFAEAVESLGPADPARRAELQPDPLRGRLRPLPPGRGLRHEPDLRPAGPARQRGGLPAAPPRLRGRARRRARHPTGHPHRRRGRGPHPGRCSCCPLDGPSPGNLVAAAPGAGVCFAGALCSFGATPLGFEADFEAWSAALDAVAEIGAARSCPASGPVGGRGGASASSSRTCAPAWPRAATSSGWHPVRGTGGRSRRSTRVNVERAALAAAGDDRVPEAMLRLIGL